MAQDASKRARVDGYFTVVRKDPAPHGSLIAALAAASAAASASASAAATADGASGGDNDSVENAGDDDDDMGGAGGAGIAGGGYDNDVGTASDDDDVGGGGGGGNEGTPMPVNDLATKRPIDIDLMYTSAACPFRVRLRRSIQLNQDKARGPGRT